MTGDFRQWIAFMGFNKKQVLAAAETIGISSAGTASNTYTGKRELTKTERLAMSAVRAGLQPWTPSYDAELTAVSPERETTAA